MSVAITIIGQGTVTQTTASYDESYTAYGGATLRIAGTVHTLTASAAQGWQFKRWYQPSVQRTSYWSDGTSDTYTRYPLAANPRRPGGETSDNPTTTNLPSPLSSPPTVDKLYLFEGSWRESDASGEFGHDEYHDLAITAEFELAPIADGPILRTDSSNPRILRSDAGVIIRQG